MPRILVVEDDPSFGQRLVRNLGLDGFEAELAEGGQQGLALLASTHFDAAICDVKMPGMGGLELLTKVREGKEPGVDADLPFLMLTSIQSVETAVDAMRRGASDYLTKESGRGEIVMRLKRAMERRQLSEENNRLRETIARTEDPFEMVGSSAAMEAIKAEIAEVAPTDATVMILGETGAGKELVARAIHKASGRKGLFLDINAALLPDDTSFQSELFGHERGAFTDAFALKKGKLELADGGTLFLDEIGEVSPAVQAKLLRVLETMTFTRLGGTRPIRADVRIVVATNRDLKDRIAAGQFRSDLYYRLNVFPVNVPPLRQRREDIAALTRYFVMRYAAKYGRAIPMIEVGALEKLRAYDWPGNIRELRNICERLVIRARGANTIAAADVAACGLVSAPAESLPRGIEIPETGIDIDDLERQLVVEALRKTDWNQTEAARLLGISVDRMNNRVKKFGLKHDNWRVNKGG